MSGPLETAGRQSRAWTTSRLVVLEDTGHGGEDSFPAAVVEALNGFIRA